MRKKIIMLSLFPAFLNAGVFESFGHGLGNGFGESIGSNIVHSRWYHWALEAMCNLGCLSKPKREDLKKNNDSVTSGADADFKLSGHNLLKFGIGFKVYSGLGTDYFNMGLSFGFCYLFNNSAAIDLNYYIFARYSNFFTRLSVGLQVYSCFLDDTTYDNKLKLSGIVTRLQFGYLFYGPFYLALSVSYSHLKSNAISNVSYVFDLRQSKKILTNSFAVNVSLGMLSDSYSENIKSVEEMARAKEIAKLEAKAEFERRQAERNQAETNQVESAKSQKSKKNKAVSQPSSDAISFEEYQAYMKLKNSRVNG